MKKFLMELEKKCIHLQKRDEDPLKSLHDYFIKPILSNPMKYFFIYSLSFQLIAVLLFIWHLHKGVVTIQQYPTFIASTLLIVIIIVTRFVFGRSQIFSNKFETLTNTIQKAKNITQRRIHLESILLKLSLVVLILMYFVTMGVYMMPSKTENIKTDIVDFFDRHFGYWSAYLSFLYYLASLPTMSLIIYNIAGVIYYGQHIKYQLYILNDLVKELFKSKKYFTTDQQYQKFITTNLIVCIKVYENTKRFLDSQIQVWKWCLLIYHSFFLVFIFFIQLYFFLTIDDFTEYPKIASLYLLMSIVGGLSLIIGEGVKEQSRLVFANLCTCNWYEWNMENRRILLIFLLRSQHPLCYKVSNIVSFEYAYGMKMLKIFISCMAYAQHVAHHKK